MKAPVGFNPDMLTVVEIVQHAAEIVSRLPLSLLKDSLRQVAPDDPALPWYEQAARLVESAQCMELDCGKLSAIEARTEATVVVTPDAINRDIPDDWHNGG